LERVAWSMLRFWKSDTVDPSADATIQEERLWVADPKAIHRILQGPSYLYETPYTKRVLMATIMDRGLPSTEGNFPLIFHVARLPNSELRRSTQTAQEGHESRVRSRRGKSLVPVHRPVFQFGQLFPHPRLTSKLKVPSLDSSRTNGTRPSRKGSRDKLRLSRYFLGSTKQRWICASVGQKRDLRHAH
jgi:hypothetical protein